MWSRRWLGKLANLLRRERADGEMEREMRAHLALIEDELVRQGMPLDQARLAARKAFGGVEQARELHRDERSLPGVEALWRDLRYACRGLPKAPGFTSVTVAMLALGLGATTAMFSIVSGVLLRPMPYREPGRLFLARTIPPARAGLTENLPVNARHFHEWRTRCQLCEQVTLFQFVDLTLLGAGEPARLAGLSVSWNFFATLGVAPALGRDFLGGEEAPGLWDKVILTDQLWRTRFAADPSIVGHAIQINGEPHTVIGVMPASLQLPKGAEWGAFFGPAMAPQIFRPLNFDPSRGSANGNLNYSSLLRLRPGVAPERASAELTALLADFVREFHLEGRIALIPLQQEVTRASRLSLWLLFAMVGAVLLIVCANAGSLMLVRTMGRHREAGIRLAIGASRARLFSFALEEALILVVAGGVIGMALAHAALIVIKANPAIDLPRLAEVRLDWRVFAFAALAAAVSTVLCGLIPAWRLASTEPVESLKSSSSNASESRHSLGWRQMLVGAEVALSTLLLIAGAQLLLSFLHVLGAEKGFEASSRVVTQDVSFLNPKYGGGGRRRFTEDTVRKLAAAPGVQAAGAISQLPLEGEVWVGGLRDADQPGRADEDSALANFRFTTPGYFAAMGIPLKRGRFLEDGDKDRPVAVISERAAQVLWPGADPLGRHVRGTGNKPLPLEVVGVVGEVRAELEHEPPMTIYEHYWHMQPIAMSFVLRTRSDAATATRTLRETLSSADPELALAPAQTMEQILDNSVAARKQQTYVAAGFASLALVLAALGIYGIISFAVTRRAAEMGVRIALGARPGQLIAMVVRQGMTPVWLGLAAGLAGSLPLGRLVSSQLFGVSPNDPVIAAVIASVLIAVGAAACWLPARRIAGVDPVAALRLE